MLYVGDPYITEENREKVPADYPMHFDHPMMRDDRIVGVLDIDSWFDFLRQQDFNFGSRIHGNIAAVLSGVPCYIYAGDCRVKELADYHHIPCITANDLTGDMDVISMYEKTDYSRLKDGHEERFSHYLDFLDANQVPRISREAMNGTDTVFDRMRARKSRLGLIHPFSVIGVAEQEKRLAEYLGKYRRESMELLRNADNQRKKAEALQREKAALQKELAQIKGSRFYKMKTKYDSFMKR